MDVFFLGVPEVVWCERFSFPVMISRRRFARKVHVPVASGDVMLDSSGYTELSINGDWTVPAGDYAVEAERVRVGTKRLVAAAIQDWMCEPSVRAKTKLTVRQHQERTVDSFVELAGLAPDVPWMPVLQGWEPTEYFDHVEQYARRGIDLRRFEYVGVGTMCRRQSTDDAEAVLAELSSYNLKLHGFGFKTDGLGRCGKYLRSSDSMAWSRDARWGKPLDECGHANCANCGKYAELWRDRVLWVAGLSDKPVDAPYRKR